MNKMSPNLRRSAGRLRWVTLAAIVLIEAVMLIAIWALLSGRGTDIGFLQIRTGSLPPWPAASIVALIGLFVGLALLRLARMLGKVEAGAPFGAAGDLRGFARWLFLSILVSILAPPAAQAALLLGGAASPHRLEFALDNGQALMLLVTGLLFLVARLLDEAQRLADDHSQIV